MGFLVPPNLSVLPICDCVCFFESWTPEYSGLGQADP